MDLQEIKFKVEKALDEVRPFLQADGGDITLLDVTEDTVKVKFEGNCIGCHISNMTLKSGVEATIKKYMPQIQNVI
ncbi:MAG: NifU family protein [Flavobacteriaceae bacterium]|nr:NifU family protein [Flavobacteriaceae bacterium]